jgi:hypothetical protein
VNVLDTIDTTVTVEWGSTRTIGTLVQLVGRSALVTALRAPEEGTAVFFRIEGETSVDGVAIDGACLSVTDSEWGEQQIDIDIQRVGTTASASVLRDFIERHGIEKGGSVSVGRNRDNADLKRFVYTLPEREPLAVKAIKRVREPSDLSEGFAVGPDTDLQASQPLPLPAKREMPATRVLPTPGALSERLAAPRISEGTLATSEPTPPEPLKVDGWEEPAKPAPAPKKEPSRPATLAKPVLTTLGKPHVEPQHAGVPDAMPAMGKSSDELASALADATALLDRPTPLCTLQAKMEPASGALRATPEAQAALQRLATPAAGYAATAVAARVSGAATAPPPPPPTDAERRSDLDEVIAVNVVAPGQHYAAPVVVEGQQGESGASLVKRLFSGLHKASSRDRIVAQPAAAEPAHAETDEAAVAQPVTRPSRPVAQPTNRPSDPSAKPDRAAIPDRRQVSSGLIAVQHLFTVDSAVRADHPVVFEAGKKKRDGVLQRVAEMKLRVRSSHVPQLYERISILLPRPAGGKDALPLRCEVTRLRPAPDGGDPSFDVRTAGTNTPQVMARLRELITTIDGSGGGAGEG